MLTYINVLKGCPLKTPKKDLAKMQNTTQQEQIPAWKKQKRYKLDVEIGKDLQDKLADLKEQKGIKPAQIVRQALALYFAKDEPLVTTTKEKANRQLVTDFERKKLRIESAISNNINQMAKALNYYVKNNTCQEKDVRRVRGQLTRILDLIYNNMEVFK